VNESAWIARIRDIETGARHNLFKSTVQLLNIFSKTSIPAALNCPEPRYSTPESLEPSRFTILLQTRKPAWDKGTSLPTVIVVIIRKRFDRLGGFGFLGGSEQNHRVSQKYDDDQQDKKQNGHRLSPIDFSRPPL
jgi:hypothetical protein